MTKQSVNKVLVVAVHPDDETLGCGGSLLRHKREGDEIHWLICTEITPGSEFYRIRQDEITQVTQAYQFDSVQQLHLRTMAVDEYSMSELIQLISMVINRIKPTWLYLPFKGDVHSDHRKIFEASYSCTKSFRYPFIKKIVMMETLSETEFAPSTPDNAFMPNLFIDISNELQQKNAIMNVFKSEVAAHPFPRSTRNIEALATLRGASAGCEYAEAFVTLKEII